MNLLKWRFADITLLVYLFLFERFFDIESPTLSLFVSSLLFLLLLLLLLSLGFVFFRSLTVRFACATRRPIVPSAR